MAKIQISPEAFASANIEAELCALVLGAIPATIDPPAASVIRDANGKVARVDINLPADIAAVDLTAAKVAVQAHPGVASASSFPLGGVLEDFSSLTPGDVLASGAVSAAVDLAGVASRFVPSGESELKSAQSADSIGAAGSALELSDKDAASTKAPQFAGTHVVIAADNSLAGLGAWEWSLKLKMTALLAGDVLKRVRLSGSNFHGALALEYLPTEHGSDNWHIRDFITNTVIDTGVVVTDFVELKIKMGLDGIASFTVGANTKTRNVGFVPTISRLSFIASALERHSTTASRQIAGKLIIDDETVTILSGSENP